MVEVVFTHARFVQQAIVQRPAFRRQRNPALLYLAKTRAVGPLVLPGKDHRFFEGLKTGLAQQNRHLAARRPPSIKAFGTIPHSGISA